MDFGCLPCLALVVAIWIGIGWIPGTVEPVEVGLVVGDPLLDRLPDWFDRLHGVDVEGRRWARERDDSTTGPSGGNPGWGSANDLTAIAYQIMETTPP